MRGPTWTKEEKELLTKLVSEGKSNAEIAELMNKPRMAIKAQRKTLKLKTRFFHDWTEEQKEYITNNSNKTDEELSKDLGISIWAVKNFKNKHKLRKVKEPYWTDYERELVKILFPYCNHKEIGEIIGRSRLAISRFCERNGLLGDEPRKIKIGDKFERLTVVSDKFYKKHIDANYAYVKVQCSCGSPEKEVQVAALFSNATKSCGCLQKEKISRKNVNNPKFQHDRGIPKQAYDIARRNAYKRNLPFEIDFKRFVDMFFEQDCKCAFSGIKLQFYPSQKEKKLQTASFDRINSCFGYIEGNCQWIHKWFQNLKQEYPEALFFDYCYHIVYPLVHTKSNINIDNCDISDKFFKKYESSAKYRNLSFTITKEDMIQKFFKQDGYCALTGFPIRLVMDYPHNAIIQTASLDRKNNDRGYETDNIQWILQDLNYIRRNLTIEELKYRCKLIVDYLLKDYRYSR